MSYLTNFRDSLFDLISGLGTSKDPTARAQWHLRLLNRNEVEHAYRTDWVSRKLVDAPAEDATREWRAWQADEKEVQAIEACEELHKMQLKTRMALVRARLYGGAALVFAVKNQDPATELVMETIKKGDLEWVVVMNRYELMAGPRIFNVMSPYYTRPEYYTVSTPVFGLEGEQGNTYPLPDDPKPAVPKDRNRQQTPSMGMVRVHPSRVIEFNGNELPDWRLVPMGGGWGDSILQTVDDVLKDLGMVVGGIANMINDAKVDIIKIPDFSKQVATTEYANRLLARFAYANQAKSTVNSLLLDTNEEWQRITSNNFAGLTDVMHQYLLLAGGSVGIPMSILVGQSGGRGMGGGGSGGGSTGGEGGGTADVRNYYDRIASKQETVYGPAMAPLDQVLVRSSIGTWDPGIKYNWNPLYQDDATTISTNEVAKQNAMKLLVESGLINEEVLRQVQVNMLSDQDDFWIGIEDAIEEFGAEPEEPDIQVPWSRLAGAMAQLGGGGSNGGPGNGGGGSAGGGPSGNPGGNGGGTGGKPDILGALGAKLAPPKLPNMRVTSDADAKVTKDSVNYRPAGKYSEQKCGTCDMFEPPISCSHVAGHIHRPDTCDDWEGKGGEAKDGLTYEQAKRLLADDAATDTRSFQLIRHGATSLNNDDVSVDRIRGWQDVPLSKDGRTEAHKIGRQMAKSDPPDVIHTSDLARSADTARIIAKHCNVAKVKETQGLRPWDLGDYSGKTTKECLPQIKEHACDKPDQKVPGGEAFNTFRSRFFKGLHDSLNSAKDGHKVAIVTHHRGERLLKAWKKAGFPKDGHIDADEFNRKGEPTGHAEDFEVPMGRLKNAASA